MLTFDLREVHVEKNSKAQCNTVSHLSLMKGVLIQKGYDKC